MATLGFGDLKDIQVHPLWDLTEMKKLQLSDGSTFDNMVGEIQDMANEFNRSLLSMPKYNLLWSVQDNVEVEYPIGVSGGVQEATEYSAPDPMVGKTTGHNIPIRNWTRALGWTMKGLRKRPRTKLDADLAGAVADLRDHFQQRLFQRYFKMEAERVGSISTASVPFADGGTNDATYIPLPSKEGTSFLATHDHYLRHAALNDANLLLAVEHLREHGHEPPFTVYGSSLDAATWAGLTGWKVPEWPDLIYHSSAQIRANINDIQEYRGYVETPSGIVKVWLSERIPTAYYAVFKDYGPLDRRNPLRMRIDPDYGFGWAVVPGLFVNAPTLLAVMEAYYDFGIGEDRTNSVFVFVETSGDYVSPTIT